MYSLLGTGYFLTPRSADVYALIAEWIDSHPEALATPVGSLAPMNADGTGQIVYVWLTDGNGPDLSLNLWLVRQGAFPGGTMQDVRATDERRPPDPDDETRVERFVPDETYDAFIGRVVEAETAARAEGLGVWDAEAP